MKVTVITVAFNSAATIADCMQSVLDQTHPDIEYIVVDGQSNDNTIDIIREFEPKFTNRLRWVSEKDNGIYDAMNKGIKLATGDYLCFLNAGDGLHEDDTLLQMVHSINGTALPGVLYGETEIVDSQGHFLYMRRLSAPATLTWKSFKQGMLVCHQAFFARRDLVEPYDLRYRFSADFDWCIRIMKKADVLHNTHLTLIDYLNEGMTTRNHKASLKERFRIMSRHYGWASTVTHHLWFVLRLLYK